ncbi:phenoloxidase-activating factor 3-like [Amphibalanus amphitrite]|uniref:phenoloxidase-activating factor 3-like n=1 Tax=Amphibalanus amphitrite TaxID=1232801 RepID=UPI001C912949|nr:phenoloxidase-activating factor 3-like [Amphibalanus amphitrite]
MLSRLLLTCFACWTAWPAVSGQPPEVVLLDPKDLGYLPPVTKTAASSAVDTRCGVNVPSAEPTKEAVHLGEYPWMARLGYTRRSKKSKRVVYSCGGTLITERYVLTAAHCVSRLPKDLAMTAVRLGEHNITTERDCLETPSGEVCSDEVQDFGVEEVIPHPEHHRPRQYHNDIALVRLDRPVERSEFVRPICLPFDPSVRRNITGKTVTLAGFGSIGVPNDALRELHVPVVDSQKCVKAFQRFRTAIGPHQLCAGGQKGRGACAGDAGGPLMAAAVPGQPRVLVGVVSFGPATCGTQNVPDVYTRVADYKDWIVENMKN